MRRLSFSALIILLSLLALIRPACAQDDDDDDDDYTRSAVLSLYLDPAGKTNVSFYSGVEVAKLEGLPDVLASTLGCSVGSLQPPAYHEYPGGTPAQKERYRAAQERTARFQLQGECRPAVAREGLQSSVRLNFDPVLPVLRKSGIERLSVTIATRNLANLRFDSPSQISSRYGMYSFQLSTSQADAGIALHWGFRQSDLVFPFAFAVAFILIPCSILLWMRSRALRLRTSDRAGAWFSYVRTQNLCVTGVFLLWIGGGFTVRNQLSEILAAAFVGSRFLAALCSMVYVYLPPVAVLLFAAVASHRVLTEVRQIEWRFRDYLLLQLSQFGIIMIPVLGIYGAVQSIPSYPRASMLVIALSFVLIFVAARMRRRLTGTYPEPINSGEFHDRIFLLARRAGVTLRQIFLLPSGKLPMANAFATGNGTVMVTDYILQKLNRREVEAVAAHEIGHLQYKHPRKLAVAFMSVILVPWIFRSLFSPLAELLPAVTASLWHRPAYSFRGDFGGFAPFADLLLAAFCLLGAYALSRRYEHVADARSVTLTDDPEAFITAFAKLSLINLTPLQWGRTSGALVTHPSTMKRIRRIAELGNVSEERLQELLRNPDSTKDGSAAPELFESPRPSSEYVYPAREQLQKATANLLVLVLISTAVPALFSYFATSTTLTGAQQLGVLFAGVVATFASYLVALRWRVVSGKQSLHRKFEERLKPQYPGLDFSHAKLVGYSPEAHPRFHYVLSHWDTGLLLPVREGLLFLGDQAKFLLPFSAIREHVIGPGMPGWWNLPRTYLRWEQADKRGVANLLPLDYSSLWSIARSIGESQATIESWLANGSGLPPAPHGCAALDLPATPNLKSKTPREAYPLNSAFKVAVPAAVVGIFISNATFSFWPMLYVPGVVLLLRLVEFAPYRRYRDRQLPPEWCPSKVVENKAATHANH